MNYPAKLTSIGIGKGMRLALDLAVDREVADLLRQCRGLENKAYLRLNKGGRIHSNDKMRTKSLTVVMIWQFDCS